MKGGPGKNKQGDPMKPHAKYGGGGMAKNKDKKKYGGGGIAEAYEDAREDQPTGRLSDRDIRRAVKRAGLK
jgi:hypothetical protein